MTCHSVTIDREGVDELEIAKVYHDDERSKLLQANERLRDELAGFKERLAKENTSKATAGSVQGSG